MSLQQAVSGTGGGGGGGSDGEVALDGDEDGTDLMSLLMEEVRRNDQTH